MWVWVWSTAFQPTLNWITCLLQWTLLDWAFTILVHNVEGRNLCNYECQTHWLLCAFCYNMLWVMKVRHANFALNSLMIMYNGTYILYSWFILYSWCLSCAYCIHIHAECNVTCSLEETFNQQMCSCGENRFNTPSTYWQSTYNGTSL